MSSLKWQIAQKLEINWWKRYLRKKSPAKYLAWKKKYWQTFLSNLQLNIRPDSKILDAGCGPAGIFISLPNHKVTALDPLIGQYELLPHFKKENYPNVNFVNKPLENAELPQFDYVFCLNAINHVADLEDSMNKIAESVSSEGQLILSIDVHNFQFLKHVFRLLPGDALHPHQNDLKEYEEMLTERGFKIKDRFLMKKEFIFNYWALVAVKF